MNPKSKKILVLIALVLVYAGLIYSIVLGQLFPGFRLGILYLCIFGVLVADMVQYRPNK